MAATETAIHQIDITQGEPNFVGQFPYAAF